VAVAPCVGSLADQEKLEWFGTVRGRLGMLASPSWLFYVTGGLAYGEIASNETLTSVGGGAVLVGPLSAAFNTTRAGWTVAAAWRAWSVANWTAKVEYLYMDFGTINSTYTGVAPFSPAFLSTHVTDNVVRAGLNYHFH